MCVCVCNDSLTLVYRQLGPHPRSPFFLFLDLGSSSGPWSARFLAEAGPRTSPIFASLSRPMRPTLFLYRYVLMCVCVCVCVCAQADTGWTSLLLFVTWVGTTVISKLEGAVLASLLGPREVQVREPSCLVQVQQGGLDCHHCFMSMVTIQGRSLLNYETAIWRGEFFHWYKFFGDTLSGFHLGGGGICSPLDFYLPSPSKFKISTNRQICFKTGPLQWPCDVPQRLMYLTIIYDRSHALDGHQRTVFDVSTFCEAFLRICALNTLLLLYTLYLYSMSYT